jgi:pimeloyl-ACP methyl ester carboxylesterase/DNA-binding CsgD family transcriptional regulator
MTDPPLHYAHTADGVAIAYQVHGGGPPLVLAPVCPWSHIQLQWSLPQVRAWLEQLGQHARVVRFDGRGTGLSERAGADFSLAAQVRDLAAVVDQLGLPRVALAGMLTGVPMVLAYAATYPERVSHLVLWCGFVRTGDLPPTLFTLEQLAAQDWATYTAIMTRLFANWPDEQLAPAHVAFIRACVDQDTLVQNLPTFHAIDAGWALPLIAAPTLVLTRRHAPYLGVDMARSLASRIPGAQLTILDGAALAPFAEDRAAVVAALHAFLATSSPPPPALAAAPMSPAALTKREREVLQLLAQGHSGREIAAQLGISRATVQRHIANLYAKLGVRGRVEAAAYAFSRGLVAPATAPT